MIAKTDNINEIPTVLIDGSPISEMAYITYRSDHNKYSDFAKAGVRLFSVNLNFSEMPINERAPVLIFQKGIFEQGKPDFSIIDRNFRQILDPAPDAYIFPRVNLNLPREWEESHPLELCEKGFGDRKRFSFASDLWAREVRERLLELVGYIEQSEYKDRVIGYQLAAGNTEEWLSIDPQSGFGERAKEKFDIYCNDRGVPRNEKSYYSFMSETVASRISDLASAVKNLTNRKKLVGCFYGYTLFVGREECHNALGRLLDCDDVDFVCSPLTYSELRAPGMDLFPMVPIASVRHHKKIYFSENDIRTHLSRPVHEHPNYTSPIWYGPDRYFSAEQMKLSFCRAMLYGYGMWWFDMWGGWYADPVYMELIKKMRELCERGMDVPDVELAVYIDENSIIEKSGAQDSVKGAMRSLGLCGTPYDVYLMSDFRETFDKYKACVFIEPSRTELSCSCAKLAEDESKPLLRIGDSIPSPDELREWIGGVGIELNVDRSAVVYRGQKYISLYTPEDGVYDLCDKGRRAFIDAFESKEITFPTSLPRGKVLLLERHA